MTVYMKNGTRFRTGISVPRNDEVSKIVVNSFTDDKPASKVLMERDGGIE